MSGEIRSRDGDLAGRRADEQVHRIPDPLTPEQLPHAVAARRRLADPALVNASQHAPAIGADAHVLLRLPSLLGCGATANRLVRGHIKQDREGLVVIHYVAILSARAWCPAPARSPYPRRTLHHDCVGVIARIPPA